MILIKKHQKCHIFGGANKETKAAPTKTKTKYRSKVFKEPNLGGMLMASEFPISDSIGKTSSKNKSPSTKKKDVIYNELNKYGMIALVAGTLANHSTNTAHKMMAAISGDTEKFKHYEEKSKSYIKPHFSLPSQWHQPRITFGTPWYY